MKELQRQVNEAKATSGSSGGGNDLDLKVKWKGAPELSSTDGAFKFKVRGRLMADYDSIDQDEAVTGLGDKNGVELRRGRIGVEGTVYYDWKYKFEVDFAGDGSEIKDAYLAYANWWDIDKSEIIVGNFKNAMSLEQLTSSRFITFMERAAYIDAFGFDRAIGAGVWVGDEHWSLQVGGYGAESGDQETWDDDPTQVTVRGTVAPINNDTTVVHLGASYRHRNAGTNEDSGVAELFRYRARAADLHLADRIVQTPRIAENDDTFNLEGAFVWNRFSLQGEYAQLSADTARAVAGNASPEYNGWYVEASMFLTDDMRNYSASTGEFKRQKVKNPVWGGSGGWGAWQIAARYDVFEAGDAATQIRDFGVVSCDGCGRQETWLIGLNWWLTDHTALKFNVTQSDISGIIGVDDRRVDPEVTGFGMRAQIDW
jgi:phosphate-selective porin OprO/OprP